MIFRFEIRRQLITNIIWAIIILCVMYVLMAGVYPIFYASKSEVMKVLEGFPPTFAAAFGMNIEKMFTFNGYYVFAFSYISLLGAIMASALAIASFAREKRMHCSDFLLTKPITRSSIFIQKLMHGLVVLLLFNLVYIVLLLLLNHESFNEMLLASFSLLFTQLVFFGLGVLYATFAKRIRSVAGIATVFGFGAFILSALVNILEEDKLRFVDPLKYFDPSAIFLNGSYDTVYAITGILVFIASISVAYIRFNKQDIHSV